ncbi:MAG: hypothetical protein WDM89_11740 [Rhizomicrobium sp.]
MLDSGHIVIGTPDDAIRVLETLQSKQGEFGCFLHQAHDWADWEQTKRSYELYARFVVPHFQKSNRNRNASYDEIKANSQELADKSRTAAQRTFDKFKMEDAQKGGLKKWPFA